MEPEVIKFEVVCLAYNIETIDGGFTSRNTFTYDINEGYYTGTLNGLDYFIVQNNNGNWELRIQSPNGDLIVSNNELIGTYGPNPSYPGYNEEYWVESGSCRGEIGPLLKSGFCLNLYDPSTKTYKKILMEYNFTSNDGSYLGYEQLKDGYVRVWQIVLINNTWTLIFTENLPNVNPTISYGPSNNNGAEMNDYLPIPLSNNWTEYNITGAFDEENMEVYTNVCRTSGCCDPLCLKITLDDGVVEYSESFILSPVTDENGDFIYYSGWMVDANSISYPVNLKFNSISNRWELTSAGNFNIPGLILAYLDGSSEIGTYTADNLSGYEINIIQPTNLSNGLPTYCDFTSSLGEPNKIYNI